MLHSYWSKALDWQSIRPKQNRSLFNPSSILFGYRLFVNFFFRNNDVIRIDATAEQLSSLSQGSIDLLADIDGQVEIDAFISPAEAMPEHMFKHE